jgi:isohexenylglutaconyl-CoA hydratase
MTINLPSCNTIELHQESGALRITLNRPDARNAMNLAMVEELMDTFVAISESNQIRAVVLRGAEGNFCAGGDIKDMSQAGQLTGESDENRLYTLNRKFGILITQVNAAPQVVISLLEGAVLGGGFGLACVSDIAIADSKAQFGIPETTLGIPPAQIAPFVVARVGLTQARRLVLTGARFDGDEARALGVAHFTTASSEELQNVGEQQLQQVMRCAPLANRLTKDLILSVGKIEHEQLLDNAAKAFAEAVQSDEGREGMRAFIEKRPARWAK